MDQTKKTPRWMWLFVAAVAGAILLAVVWNGTRWMRQQPRAKETLASTGAIWDALHSYHESYGSFPKSASGLVQEVSHLLEPYVRSEFSKLDGWGRDIYYVSSGDRFVLWSVGSDGLRDKRHIGGRVKQYWRDVVWTETDAWQYTAGHGDPPKEKQVPFSREMMRGIDVDMPDSSPIATPPN